MIEIDALNYIVAKIISQYDNNENFRFITYFLIKMLFVKCNYKIYNEKILIIIRVFEFWRFELEEIEQFIIILFDHKNLEYFMIIKFFNRRQARWFEFLFKFNFKIIYRFENLNRREDAFIR